MMLTKKNKDLIPIGQGSRYHALVLPAKRIKKASMISMSYFPLPIQNYNRYNSDEKRWKLAGMAVSSTPDRP